MNKTAVVFGATGLVGNELIQELIAAPDYSRIIVVTRNNFPKKNLKIILQPLREFSDLHLIKNHLQADTYFCCIGTTIKKAGSQEKFHQVDFEIPKKIALLAEELHIPGLVIISSIGAKASSGNFYLRTKGQMEAAVREAYHGNLKIVRPSLLMGKRNEFRFGEKISIVFMKIFGWTLAGPLRKYRGIKASIVAKAMIRISSYPTDKIFFESDELMNIVKEKSQIALKPS